MKIVWMYSFLLAMGISVVTSANTILSSGVDVQLEVQPVILDVEIPLATGFLIDSNEQEGFQAAQATIVNNTSTPVSVHLMGVSYVNRESSPKLVDPTYYSEEEWRLLSREKTPEHLALKVYPIEGVGWLDRAVGRWIKDSNRLEPYWLGNIKRNSKVQIGFEAKHGFNWVESKDISYEILYKVELGKY